MLAKRIIPCLDVKNGKVVKGINFQNVKEVGNPIEFAEKYNKDADELVFYDITASYENRSLFVDVVSAVAKKIFIPLSVGGGVKSVEDFRCLLRAGADKVSINSQAIKNPMLIKEAAKIFGKQCVVLGVDAKKNADGKYSVYLNGGRVDAHLDLIEWVTKAEELGVGEICLNSIDTDGVKDGFDIAMLNMVCENVNIPVIASGGCGKKSDFLDVFTKTKASAALASSVFHNDLLTIKEVKEYLKSNNIPVRVV